MAPLTLIPTPIDSSSPLEPIAKETLLACKPQDFIFVEDIKSTRARFINWGLPKNLFDRFYELSEHTSATDIQKYLDYLKTGNQAYLLSDAGLPAIYDPGQTLIDLCHNNGIRVTSTPFYNSILLALALSGFRSDHFECFGFPPRKDGDRRTFFKKMDRLDHVGIILDTPYRFERTLEDLRNFKGRCFFALNLGMSSELLLRGSISELLSKLNSMTSLKHEFVVCLEPMKYS